MSNEKNNAAPDPQPAELAEQQVDALRERTPADFAIEHAGYLANASTRLLKACGELDSLVMRRDEHDDVDDSDMHAAQDRVDEASDSVRSAIYEFEKRRDRALAATGKQQVGEEVSVEEDVYCSIAGMIEPYVQREGTNPDGPLPASVHDSVQIIFDHWLKTRAPVGEVQGDGLAALSASWRSCAEKHDENAREADSIGDMTATVQYLEAKSEALRQVAAELEAALAARQPGAQEPVVVEAVATIKRDGDGELYVDWLTEGGIHDLPVGDVLLAANSAITNDEGYGEVYAAPPAQGIDLGQQQDAARWRWVREQNGVTVSVEEADDDGDMAFVSGHTPEELDAAIDGQSDAAPGVGNG